MQTLFKAFFDLCLFRLGPQDLPASRFLLSFGILLSILVSLAALSISRVSAMGYLLGDLLNLLLEAALLYAALSYLRLRARFEQTFVALLGSGVLLQLLSLPALVLIIGAEPGQALREFGLLFLLGVLGWNLAVMGHILRHAFEMRLAAGVLLAVVYFLLINTLTSFLFGSP